MNEEGGCGYLHIFRMRNEKVHFIEGFKKVVNKDGGCGYFHKFRLRNEKVHLKKVFKKVVNEEGGCGRPKFSITALLRSR